MAPVVVVHGMFNFLRGATPPEAAALRALTWQQRLAGSLALVSPGTRVPELEVAYYADLLRRELPENAQSEERAPDFDDLDEHEAFEVAQWLTAAGVEVPEDAMNLGMAPVRWMLGRLLEERGNRLTRRLREQTSDRIQQAIVSNLREVEAYTTWPERRRLVRERIADTIRRAAPGIVIAHSLGTCTTYETLHANPDIKVDLLLTLGSPLRVPALTRRLDPALRGGRGAKPAGVGRWVNIADVGDPVAVPPGLSAVFPVDQDETCDNGFGFHGLGGYLANGLTAAAVAPYLA
ncbi:hypothetical protein AVW11_20030 [Streptomyces amritsarensis]|uniref:Serine peptidase n=1 Tax=Streptomyces amritsarensis TaxID=681158 RepID=A0ABX3FZN3_9ACTN|nr:hypothetical protein [Streptomyces amritsarensis]OLZ63708.1 hypothetical protein AVW11_20030 [Streptomyces amritsarensis]